jgi:uncharacterized protein YneF (UPF0154 family)
VPWWGFIVAVVIWLFLALMLGLLLGRWLSRR